MEGPEVHEDTKSNQDECSFPEFAEQSGATHVVLHCSREGEEHGSSADKDEQREDDVAHGKSIPAAVV